MSHQNVDRVRRMHELLGGGELSSLEPERLRAVMSELLDPEVEWHDQRELPGATVHRGIDAVMHHFARSREALVEIFGTRDEGLAAARLRARDRELS